MAEADEPGRLAYNLPMRTRFPGAGGAPLPMGSLLLALALPGALPAGHAAGFSSGPPAAISSAITSRAIIRPAPRDTVQAPPGGRHIPVEPEPVEELPDGRRRLVLLDIGSGSSSGRRKPYGTGERRAELAWMGGMVREVTRDPARFGAFLGDYVEGDDASLVIGVAPGDGDYRVILTLGDPLEERGPVNIGSQGQPVAEGLTIRANEPIEVEFETRPVDGRISVELHGVDCHPWALAGCTIYGPEGARLAPLSVDTERRSLAPPADSLVMIPRDRARDVLRSYCEFLIGSAPVDGGYSWSGTWYQNAYPLRTLLAGSQLLRQPAWRDSAFVVLDRFVAEQRPDGGWHSTYFGRPGCPLAARADTSSANLADIGSMALCLTLAAPLADEVRAERYLAAARRYADSIVLPAQLESGAFPNLRYQGRDYRHPYSIATATQASNLLALGAVTGDARYSQAGERAALWLAGSFRSDGFVTWYPHDQPKPRVVQPTFFGELFYMVEALAWARRLAPTERARKSFTDVLERYVWGPRSLRAFALQDYLWSSRGAWSDSKMGGVLFVLAQLDPWKRSGDDARWMDRLLSWYGDPGLSRRLGVMSPPWSLTGEYSMVATGFAGIGVAAMIDPDVLMPAPREARR